MMSSPVGTQVPGRQGGRWSRASALLQVVLLLLPVLAWAQAGGLVPVPALTGRVVDLTGTLAPGEVTALESRLADLEARKGSQVAVLLVPTARPEAIEQFSIRVADAWQLGRQGVDDGLLLLVTTADREVRIEVGRGLEGVIPDAIANRIIDEYLVPAFRAGDFAGGINSALDRITGLIDGEPLPAPRAAPSADPLAEVFPFVFITALVAGGLLRKPLGQVPGALATGALTGILAWVIAGLVGLAIAMAVLGFVLALPGAGRPGRWTSHRRGGFGGGFGGGGGFRGGGGGFGGGGASGRW